MRANPGLEAVSSNQYAGADVEGAYKKGEAILSQHKRPDGSLAIDGIFCATRAAPSACCACSRTGWAGKVKFVGFDARQPREAAGRWPD